MSSTRDPFAASSAARHTTADDVAPDAGTGSTTAPGATPGTTAGAGAGAGAGAAAPGAASGPADQRSVGELVGEVSRDLSTLVRQEIELAKAEAKQAAQRAGKGAGMFGGAGVAGYMVLLFLSLALWWALGTVMGLGWSALVVAGVWAVVAAVLALRGRKELQSVEGLPQTADSVKKIPDALRGHEERNS